MGLIVLHSAHFSKIFKRLMGATCNLKWRDVGERERVWVMEPGHPITAGLGEYFEIPKAEMYGERFDIPAPGTLVFASWFEGGEIFRSGCLFPAGARQGLLFSARARNISNLSSARGASGHHQCRLLGHAGGRREGQIRTGAEAY